MPVSWLRVGCAAWTCQPPTPTPPSAAARSALERPPTYPHLRKNSAACGGVYLPTPLGSEGKSVSLGIPLEKECSPAGFTPRRGRTARRGKCVSYNKLALLAGTAAADIHLDSRIAGHTTGETAREALTDTVQP